MTSFIYTLLAYTFLHNVVLSTGFGFSVMLRTVRTRRNILPFSALMCIFSVLIMALCYPIDYMVERSMLSIRWLRPVVVIAVAAVIYVLFRFAVMKLLPEIYERISRLIPVAVFNNLVIGICMIVYLRSTLTFFAVIATAIGATLGFLTLSWLTCEGMERLDNPDVPKAFRGLPSTMIYLGLLALATMGWNT